MAVLVVARAEAIAAEVGVPAAASERPNPLLAASHTFSAGPTRTERALSSLMVAFFAAARNPLAAGSAVPMTLGTSHHHELAPLRRGFSHGVDQMMRGAGLLAQFQPEFGRDVLGLAHAHLLARLADLSF